MDKHSWFINKLFVGNFIFEWVKNNCLYTSITIVSTELNYFYDYYQMLISLLNINHLFSHCEVVTGIVFNTNNSTEHYSFICTQSNGSKYCFVIPIIQLKQTVKEF